MNSSLQNYIDIIIEKIESKNCILFLGAGASISAGGKKWFELTQNLISHFNKIQFESNDFFEICEEICQTHPYTRNDLINYIKQDFELLNPSKYHYLLTKYDWGAIFTTNYDDVIEESYRNAERLKPCHQYVKADISFDYGRDKMKLFKLMGCNRYANEKIEDGGLVLTQSDYDCNLSLKSKYFDILYDILKNGTVLFIGYSFEDKIISRLLNLIFREEKIETLPWSYYISPETPNVKKEKFLNNKKIKHIQMGFEEFITEIDKNYDKSKIEKQKKNIQLNIKGETCLIDYEEYVRDFADYIELISQDTFKCKKGNTSDFFNGKDKSYLPFMNSWDIKRNLYVRNDTGIKARIENELTNESLTEPRQNKVLIIEGDAGSGKSILLKRIAYDVYNELNLPVLFLKNSKSAYDPKLISDIVYKIGYKEYKDANIKMLILIDDVAKSLRQVINLKNILSGMGISALFVIADRSNDIELSLDENLISIEACNRYRLDDNIDDEEKDYLFEHLVKLGYVFSKELIDEEIKSYNSFFALIYSLVDPSHMPLEKSLRIQYCNLTSKMQEIYLIISLFYQFNISINIEWLLRIIKVPYDKFYDSFIKEGKGILIEEQDERGNVLFRLPHRIIAELIIKQQYIDKEYMKDLFINAFKVVNLQNNIERNICKKLVYYNFNIKNSNCIFEYDQIEELFKTLGKNNKYRFIYHHWGILKTKKGIDYYPEAENILNQALKFDEDDEFMGRESVSGVLTSLGTLYSRWYSESIEKDFEKIIMAEQCFSQATGVTKNVHPYHAHANMYYQLGNQENNNDKKYDYYSKSLSIINKAKNVLNEEELQRILEIQIKVYSKLNSETDEVVRVLEEKYGSLKGYFIKALFLFIEGEEENNTDKINCSYELLNELYNEGKIDEECLRLQLTIYFKYRVIRFDEVFNILNKWYNLSTDTDDIFILYHLGVSSFNIKKYLLSKEVFKKLDRLSNGFKLRSKPNFFMKDGKENKKFEGEVVTVNYENNIGFIKCLSLKGYDELFQFRPYQIRKHSVISKGTLVEFNIAFTYRGPIALDINKK